jgi:hypothetical protein
VVNNFSKSDTAAGLGLRFYTREQIAELYAAYRNGAYKGRELEWTRQEADLYRAQRDGRVRGGITNFDK